MLVVGRLSNLVLSSLRGKLGRAMSQPNCKRAKVTATVQPCHAIRGAASPRRLCSGAPPAAAKTDDAATAEVQQAHTPVQDAAEAAAPAAAAGAERQPQQQQPDQQPDQQGEQEGEAPRKKVVVMPTPIPPPTVPSDEEAWQNGVLLVDKPQTWTSFDVCAKLRSALKRLKVKKVGHAGTLDPMATGLLIVCVGRGTKAVDSFMAMTKEYSGTLRLGEGTPSYDADSEVTERLPWEHITDEQLLAARDGFLGSIQQVPPMFSAIRVGGKRLYEAAREGKEVERAARSVTVEAFDLHRDAADPQSVHFRVVCSKGTYIRSLAYDLGRKLGTAAHLTALRREAIGEYRVDAAWQVQDLAEQLYQRGKELGGGAQQGGRGGQGGKGARGGRGGRGPRAAEEQAAAEQEAQAAVVAEEQAGASPAAAAPGDGTAAAQDVAAQ